VAVEEFGAKGVFQRADTLAYGRLAEIELLRSAREAFFLRRGQEDAQLRKLCHATSMSRFPIQSAMKSE